MSTKKLLEDHKEDLTGRDRIVNNVLYSWGSYAIILVLGFILPRMIDNHIGQVSLGIWDLSWSLVSYFNYAMLGLGSSVNRYVAIYRIENDYDGLRKTVSSVLFLQIGVAAFVLFLTSLLVWKLHILFAKIPGSEIEGARWVIACLGTSIAIQFSCDISKGVITGCHRWDLFNTIMTSSQAIGVVLMVIALIAGGGLRAISSVYLFSIIITEFIRMVVAHRICPELSIRLSYFSWQHAKKMFMFGGKTFLTAIPQLIFVQTTNVIVATIFGPATLAIFSRPLALVRHFNSFMSKFSFTLTPTAGAILRSGGKDELRRFLLDSTFYGVAFSLPIVILLSIYGDLILGIWMGSQYANGQVMAILAIGYLLPVSQNSVLRILIGMNLHGKISAIVIIVSISIFGLGIVANNILGWSLVNAALLIAIPSTIGHGIIVPIYACRHLDIHLTEYIRYVFIAPFVCGFVFALWLIANRTFFQDDFLYTFVIGGIGGALIQMVFFWRYVLSEYYKVKILNSIKVKLRAS